MYQHWQRRKRNTRVLWGMMLLAIAYVVSLHVLRTLTGKYLLDSLIGVLLGLYICSHPAANAVELFFFERDALRQLPASWAGRGWLALNVLVVLAGYIVILIGTTRLAAMASAPPQSWLGAWGGG